MLQARSANYKNGSKFTMSLKARDIYIGLPDRVDYDGTFDLPAFVNTGSKCYVYLYQPTSGPAAVVAKLSTDSDHPDPTRSRLVSAFGAHNYANDRSQWGAWPITFRQTGHDIWFDGDANIEKDWLLPSDQQWSDGEKDISPWVPDGLADLIRLRVEVGATGIGPNDSDYFVQANIASDSAGRGSKEVKGRSPGTTNKYTTAIVEVPLAGRSVFCCGTRARIALLCAGFRLNT